MNKPAKTIKSGKSKGLSIAIWEKDGKDPSFSIDKRYKKKDSDEWVSTKTFFKSELIELRAMIDEALSFEASEPVKQTEFSDESMPF